MGFLDEPWEKGTDKWQAYYAGDWTLTTRQEARGYVLRGVSSVVAIVAVYRLWGDSPVWAGALAVVAARQALIFWTLDNVSTRLRDRRVVPSPEID